MLDMGHKQQASIGKRIARAATTALALAALALYGLGATNDPRLEPVQRAAIDVTTPVLALAAEPIRFIRGALTDFGDFLSVYQHNSRLREDVVRLSGWREYARQLEAENAKLRALNKVTLAPKFDFIAAQVVSSSGGTFSQSITLNAGRAQGVVDGAPALDGGGLIGRVVTLGADAARILLVTDLASRVPVKLEPSGANAIMIGTNTGRPELRFLSENGEVAPGQRILTSNDGQVFPKGLLVGTVAAGGGEVPRVDLAADLDELEFVRLLLDRSAREIESEQVIIINDTTDGGR